MYFVNKQRNGKAIVLLNTLGSTVAFLTFKECTKKLL
jgi:hypothetical protein